MKEITIDALVENIGKVTDAINAELEALDCPPKTEIAIDVAIDEIFGNIAKYAYFPETGKATVIFETERDPLSASITFIDEGKPFNPLENTDPDVSLSAEERRIGGLGIFLVKNMMDMLDYEYKDGKNVVKIKKSLL
jgi:anti-sigma regulatory factor (Ser/Thr protein kinase)